MMTTREAVGVMLRGAYAKAGFELPVLDKAGERDVAQVGKEMVDAVLRDLESSEDGLVDHSQVRALEERRGAWPAIMQLAMRWALIGGSIEFASTYSDLVMDDLAVAAEVRELVEATQHAGAAAVRMTFSEQPVELVRSVWLVPMLMWHSLVQADAESAHREGSTLWWALELVMSGAATATLFAAQQVAG